VLLIAAPPAAAADKAHQQLMAEIRMLQEQQQQLQQLIGGPADALKTVTTKLDDQSTPGVKAFADQKLLIDNVAEGVRVLREKADDTNVRLSTVSQELDAVGRRSLRCRRRHPAAAPRYIPAPRRTPTGVNTPAISPPPAPAPLISPQKMFDNAYSGLHRRPVRSRDRRLQHRTSQASPSPTRRTTRS
jgi:hypothetical protein